MITSNSDIPYLGIAFADLLDIDIIQNLKEGFGMMGMRFAGKPNKAQMVKAYDEYVKGNPADVLRCLRSENLELMNGILKRCQVAQATHERVVRTLIKVCSKRFNKKVKGEIYELRRAKA